MSAVAADLLRMAATPRYRLKLHDLAMEATGEYQTAFAGGPIARRCFSQVSGIPESVLIWRGDNEVGQILEVWEGGEMETARYEFSDL